MNDPWDVKSVRQGNHYQSCMRINGIPLLPPVLSQECRKEMQYYKLLAKEVEKRISILKPYVENDTDSDDKTDAPELPECEQNDFDPCQEKKEATFDIVIDKTTSPNWSEKSNSYSPLTKPTKEPDTNIVIGINLQLENENPLFDTTRTLHCASDENELPERDCDYTNKPLKEKELLTEVETHRKHVPKAHNETPQLDFEPADDLYVQLHTDGPSSLSSKSFTGSLHDLHSESIKETPTLIRQRSYTVLKPSPLLLAHLEVQSVNTGVDVCSISMSESLSNINLPNKKRRSWDLETAKVKWSNMAMELKKANLSKPTHDTPHRNGRKTQNSANAKLNSQVQDKNRRSTTKLNKSEPVHRPKKVSPVRNVPSQRTVVKEPISPQVKSVSKNGTPKAVNSKKEETTIKNSPGLISESDDPATRVRELYEKLQKQQLMQMANLIEKQKREQQLLQTVFEEQNAVLLKQLKNVCPKVSPVEVKHAWGDLKDDTERGPVSLSQLINTGNYDSTPNSPVAKTLSESNSFINKCDNVLKKSRDITNNIKKQQPKSRPANGRAQRPKEPQSPTEGSRTRTHSPASRNTSRRLNYDSSPTSDAESVTFREYEQMLTDRTNDTMADLNVTLPSDNSEEFRNITEKATPDRRKTSARASSPVRIRQANYTQGKVSTDSAIKSLESSIQSSMNTMCKSTVAKQTMVRAVTSQERVAATKIVAWAKGYLVRRLMGTERVQATVQTIRDALLCALQLHADRAGIRGADVDLHRRLIQQITAACYSLHDTFVASTPAERCALIAADRARRLALASRQTTPRSARRSDIMSQSFSGGLPRSRPSSASLMTQSNYETFSGDKSRARYMPSPRRRPWR